MNTGRCLKDLKRVTPASRLGLKLEDANNMAVYCWQRCLNNSTPWDKCVRYAHVHLKTAGQTSNVLLDFFQDCREKNDRDQSHRGK